MTPDSIQDSTRYVVGQLHYGNIMPGNRAEMMRDVYLNQGAHVTGGIYSNELNVSGSDIFVEGAVYCKRNIRITGDGNPSGKDITFGSTVVCPGTLLVPESATRTRFLSDIYTGMTNLKNVVVYGNVYASSATIEDSIILGGIYCRKHLKLKNCIFFTFRAGDCLIEEHTSILSPFGFAERITLGSTVNVLTFKCLFDRDEDQGKSGSIRLDSTDIYEIDLQKKEGTQEGTGKKLQVLSVAERLLNTSEIIEQFKQNRNFIEFLALNSHLSEEDKASFIRNNREELEKDLWKIIDEKSDFKELAGSASIEEMFAEYTRS